MKLPHYTNFGPLINTYTTVGANSANWSSVYTTSNTNSAYWNTAYSNLVANSAFYLLSGTEVNLGDISSLSGNWNSVYTSVNENSSYWADTRYDVTFGQDVTITGNLTALGTSTFKNTVFTTTSAVSVVNTGPGPALYVFQAAGPYDVASFYDGDGVEVLHVGNANVGQGGKVGINESYPSVELTVNGQISSNSDITVFGGNSNQWNSSYSSVNSNSSFWTNAYTNLANNSAAYLLSGTSVSLGDIPTLSASWNSVYTSFNTNSAKYDSVWTTVNTNSSSAWNYQGTDIKALTGKWDSNYTTTNNNSAAWSSVYTTFNTNSAKYDSVWTTTNSNSSNWSTAYTNLVSNSATYSGTTRQYDYVQVGLNSYSYCGYALPGTSTASSGWTINRLFFSTAGTLLSSGAVANAIWNNRYSYNY